ncbi:CDP-glycerol--glycerophosphate glycerophosphotransferase, partial [Vibrio sp. 10N.222.55.E8]
MFLLQRKPVVTFKNQQPKPHLLNIEEKQLVEAALENALSRPPELMQAVDEYCEFIHPYHDGKASHRILSAANGLIESGLVGMKKKPMNLLRHF